MLKRVLPLSLIFIISGCAHSSKDEISVKSFEKIKGYTEVSETRLDADGANGEDTYTLIRNAFGPRSIEAPDLYGSANHQGHPHITELTDPKIGDYFKFVLHRDLDHDRDVLSKSDRQRNEIKVYGRSDSSLKGYLGKTFEYRWKFRINDDLKVTRHFTHIFQLKAVKKSGSDALTNSPILTLTANIRHGRSGLEVRHVGYNSDHSGTINNTLYHTSKHNVDWQDDIKGRWFEVFVRANYAEQGNLMMTVTPVGETTPLIEVHENNIEMWRSGNDANKGNFVRPKWGIYRSLKAKEQLNATEDEVDFANFEVKEVKPVY
ncbi:hypothetical protein A9264_03385 [Vibrio sp. UCD-FRSSP16_10]|uniref:hypothetical protein n=1 Tax=unclassified Vibrio TaxID=2614977 RepID=UPI0008004C3A|nr:MULTISPECIES: hypothetical protein [unclassified Vibrio]OBT12190.1 hypothetical protein A9260_04835 [Vibrio sp. UCD-FRSSP16_30]OBT20522.1 hypothetical protein A9264_03385 [Vibrio sp. UCD-FRSSP16_10]